MNVAGNSDWPEWERVEPRGNSGQPEWERVEPQGNSGRPEWERVGLWFYIPGLGLPSSHVPMLTIRILKKWEAIHDMHGSHGKGGLSRGDMRCGGGGGRETPTVHPLIHLLFAGHFLEELSKFSPTALSILETSLSLHLWNSLCRPTWSGTYANSLVSVSKC